MKTTILLSIFLVSSIVSRAQVIVGDVDINLIDSIKVVEVFVERSTARKSVDVFLDFGQKDNTTYNSIGIRNDDLRIMNPSTKSKMVFKSTASVINFMEKNKWEHYDSLILTSGNYMGMYYYFKRKPLGY